MNAKKALFQQTLAIIKPDAVAAGHAEKILQIITKNGFQILEQKKLKMSKALAEEFYVEHVNRPFFTRLIKFMTTDDIYALAIGKNNGIEAWRELMGPTDSKIARESHPGSIRALYGTDGTRNAVHGSDSYKSAFREIHFFFPNAKIPPLPISPLDDLNENNNEDRFKNHKNLASDYYKEKIEKTLLEGLLVLVKEKVSSDKDVLLKRLGHWLLDHNPYQPKMIIPEL